ncbi:MULTISPECIES: peptide chain release factor N(5)-glutamine methyltransferase [Flavobacterium]|uniref:Release factor glutamine methyltransferase n=1 Tax=Flavobacterium jumunjinense TaxID=998845 RepID=A0ABV5GN21_9FLAO|nr:MULTISPECIES: peptide chain release factor N(5)-glutamine methyltransferase [Flavobacterium]
MLLKEIKYSFHNQLDELFGSDEVASFFFIVLEHLHQMKRVDLALQPDFSIDETQLTQWSEILRELKKEKPIQYIIGTTEFYGLPFLVNENTLIPRPETEELVEWIVESSKLKNVTSDRDEIQILDIGTGTGCIPISLKKNIPIASVYAIDVSEKALETAKKNAELNKVAIRFIETNILKLESLEEIAAKFDVIVSNPPYVRNLEKEEIKKNVLEYEPHLALFVEDDDALLFYRKIAILAKKGLKENGVLYFEINQYLGKETVDLLVALGFQNIELKKDLYGNDRMICCTL